MRQKPMAILCSSLSMHRRGLPFVAQPHRCLYGLPRMAAMNTTHPSAPRTRRPLAATRLCLSSVALATALAWGGAASAQQFNVTPAAPVLVGDPVQIALSGLPKNAEVSITARRTVTEYTGGLRTYSAQARYASGDGGGIDLATAVPLPGSSYAGADLRGLFWAMQPAVETTADKPALLPDGEVQLEARHGDTVLARYTLRLQRALPAVQSRPAEPFAGAVYAHLPGSAKRPALILLGGSEGGSLITRDAPVWASRGYAVLALPYYSPSGWGAKGPTPPELPSLPAAFADIPVERLEQARDWLARQPEVDAARIGVMGTSKGAEFALIAASRMPWIRAVVAIVPSDVVWEGWGPGVASGQRASFAWQGQPLAFVPYKDFDKELAGFATGAEVKIRRPQDAGRAANPSRVPAARIRVEDIAAPVLVAGGHDDQVWDSGGMAEAIAKTRAQKGLDTVALVYRDAGHFIGGTGWSPTTQYNAGPSKSGGTPEGTARAQAEVFARTQDFLRRVLGPLPAP
jgi:dienelactone hydrolase